MDILTWSELRLGTVKSARICPLRLSGIVRSLRVSTVHLCKQEGVQKAVRLAAVLLTFAHCW